MERAGVKLFAEKYGKKHICAMSQDTDFGRDVMDGARDELKAMNMQLVAESLQKPTDTDFSASVAKLRDAGCDLVLLGTIVRDTVQIVSAIRKSGWNVDILGNIAIYDQAVADVPGGVTEGIYTTTSVIFAEPGDPRPAVRDFEQSNKSCSGTHPILPRRWAIPRRNWWCWHCRNPAVTSRRRALSTPLRASRTTKTYSAHRP